MQYACFDVAAFCQFTEHGGSFHDPGDEDGCQQRADWHQHIAYCIIGQIKECPAEQLEVGQHPVGQRRRNAEEEDPETDDPGPFPAFDRVAFTNDRNDDLEHGKSGGQGCEQEHDQEQKEKEHAKRQLAEDGR